ncbi:MAG: ferrous iron transport protein B [Roseibacillus sp.]
MSPPGEQAPLPKVALVGHPNVGKTTLFNALTGKNRRVGNYPGVTVERTSATLRTPHGHQLELIDLPGAYSLSPNSPDETVTRDILLGDLADEPAPDLVICVVDAASLERHLYFVLQVIDTGIPVVLALNQVDRVEEKGLRINRQVLADELEIPVIACQATTGRGIVQLKQTLRFPLPPPTPRHWKGPGPIEKGIEKLSRSLAEAGMARTQAHAIHLLSDSDYRVETQPHLTSEAQLQARDIAAECIAKGLPSEDTISEARFLAIRRTIRAAVIERGSEAETLSDKIDRFALHPVWGWVIFGGIMFTIFWGIFSFAKVPMDLIEKAFGALGKGVGVLLPEGDLQDLVVDGVIAGVSGVVIFLPQIVLLFLFIGLLEGSGYMARGAFLMDKVMSRAGLTGKAFLPLLSGYACAIPGVMAARTINSPKERLLTILILPWMSCSARLPVYFLLIPLLVAGSLAQTMMMFLMYSLGTGTALLAAWILGKRIGRSEPTPQFLLELPPYRLPDFGYVLRHVMSRALAFLKKAGTVILGIVILLWALSAYPKAPEGEDQLSHSLMGRIGDAIEPLVAPLGWDGRLGAAMLTSFAAREVFNGSMAVSFAIEENKEEDDDALRERIRDRISNAKKDDGTPLYPPLAIFSLLVFYIYALQCLPTTIVVKGELRSWSWALGQLAGMSLFAYVAALTVYQGGKLFGF